MLSLEEFARESGYSVSVIHGAIRRGDLQAERPSGWAKGKLYIDKSVGDEWIKSVSVAKEDA